MSSEEEDGEEVSTRSDVSELLAGLETPGDTCAGGVAPSLPSLPGLAIAGVGPISLPLCSSQASLLAAVASQAPHGQGRKTVVDTAVRDTLQIDPSSVSLDNPAWEPALKLLVGACAEALGVNKNHVRAELYKCLLYETGGFFKPHKDTEKSAGMFGTLVIQLPSTFTGGQFVARHGAAAPRTFDLGSGGASSYSCHYVCHYADCEHELRPIESGRRLALVYSLCYVGGGPAPSLASIGGLQELKRSLRGLPKEEALLVLPLEHEYTSSSLGRLGVGCLKGADRARHQAIEAASGGSYMFLIVSATRTDIEHGDGDEYYGGFSVCDTDQGTPEITQVFNADGSDGRSELKKLSIDWTSSDDGGAVLASEDEVEEMWGDGENEGVEYTGNEGASRETTYQICVLVAFPKAAELELLCESDLCAIVREVAAKGDGERYQRVLAYIGRHAERASRTLGSNENELLLKSLFPAGPSGPRVVPNLELVLFRLLSAKKGLDTKVCAALVEVVVRCSASAVDVIPVVQKYMQSLRDSQNAFSTLGVRALFAQSLFERQGAVSDLLSRWVASDLLDALQKPLPASTQPSYSNSSQQQSKKQLLTVNTMQVLTRVGTEADFARFVDWAKGATAEELTVAIDALPKTINSDPSLAASGAQAAFALVIDLQRGAQLKVLQERRTRLEAETRWGEPIFSWAMPKAANFQPSSITSFLHSTAERTTIVLGGGINNARHVSSRLGSSYISNLLTQGFSVSASTGGTGGNAYISITKTKAYFNESVADYKRKAAELNSVYQKIAVLRGVSFSDRGDDAASSAKQSDPSQSKRQRTVEPLPEGVEVIDVE